jgi:acetolactate synthase I/II/III large subunit
LSTAAVGIGQGLASLGGSNFRRCSGVAKENSMAKRSGDGSVGRGGFLKGVAVAGTAAIAAPVAAAAQAPAAPAPTPSVPSAASPVGERGAPAELPYLESTNASDFMVDVMKSLGIEYVAAMPGSSFRGLHESIINYGMPTAPSMQLITCTHEEASVAMSHGYSKIEGKPMACMMHTTVGLQHGSMAIYNAWADRAAIFMITCNQTDLTKRRFTVPWEHTAVDGAAIVRDFTKWDDAPGSLTHFAESAVRAYQYAMTPPYGPVLLTVDTDLQEDALPPAGQLKIPPLRLAAPPQGESNAVAEAARMLVAADHPVIFADRVARTPAGIAHLVELAELLQAPVIDATGRMNFPWRHPLNQTVNQRALVAQADVVLGMEMSDFWQSVNRFVSNYTFETRSQLRPGCKTITISSISLYMKSNFQDFERYVDVDLPIAADAEATLPSLIEAVKRLITPDRRRFMDARGKTLADAHLASLAVSRANAAIGWDDSPITTARLCAELYGQIRTDDWSLLSGTDFQSRWPQQLWTADKHYQYIGDAGAFGVGYCAPASLGGALANKKHGRLSVCIQPDGDLMVANGVLWTAAHHKIPILYLMHNNRAYHQEIMAVQFMANRRQRGIDRTSIGTTIHEPNINYAKLAQSMGVYAEGPITDPKDLGPAIQRALAVVKHGEPALVDVVSQGR